MSKQSINLQDPYLNTLRKEQIRISVYLINGIKLSGVVASFDQYSLILRDPENSVNQLIYKHAISTIVPSRSFSNGHSDHNNHD